jgi:hypothetical protein
MESLITNIFTDSTKKICMCTGVSILLIILFVLSPLSNIFLVSPLMKLVAAATLVYAAYLNSQQTLLLQNAKNTTSSPQLLTQLNINLVCSYTFTVFIGLLAFFTIKSVFF